MRLKNILVLSGMISFIGCGVSYKQGDSLTKRKLDGHSNLEEFKDYRKGDIDDLMERDYISLGKIRF